MRIRIVICISNTASYHINKVIRVKEIFWDMRRCPKIIELLGEDDFLVPKWVVGRTEDRG